MPQRKELRDLLLDAIEQVKDGTLEPDKAAAVADLSQAVINADRFQLEVVQFAAENADAAKLLTRQPLLIEHAKPSKTEPKGVEDDEGPEGDDDDEDGESNLDTVEEIVREQAPIKLAEIYKQISGISRNDLFELLKDERFERDTAGCYWVAK